MTFRELDASTRRAIERAKMQLHLERRRKERIEAEVDAAEADREHKKNAAKHAESRSR